MKILNAGDHPLSNADVLDWVARKRAQYAREDAEEKAEGHKRSERSKNFLRILDRTERELTSEKYPYSKNPSAYAGDARSTAFREFALEVERVIQDALEAEWKDRLAGMTAAQIEKEFEPVQERKCLTQPELLVIYNHAPTCVEMLQPMIEAVEERFSPEEQQLMVDVIVERLRCDENGTKEP